MPLDQGITHRKPEVRVELREDGARLPAEFLMGDKKGPRRQVGVGLDLIQNMLVNGPPIEGPPLDLAAFAPEPEDLPRRRFVAQIEGPAVGAELEVAGAPHVGERAGVTRMKAQEQTVLPNQAADVRKRVAYRHDKPRIGKQPGEVSKARDGVVVLGRVAATTAG